MSPKPKGERDVLVLYVPQDQKEEEMFWLCLSTRLKGGRDVLVLFVHKTKRRKGYFSFVCPQD